MNAKQLSIIVVFACLVAPVLGGFLMPNSYTEEIAYDISEGQDITQRLNNTELVIPRYSNSILNNLYLYEEGTVGTVVGFLDSVTEGNTISAKNTNYPVYGAGTAGGGRTGTGVTDINLRSAFPVTSVYSKVVLTASNTSTVFEYSVGDDTYMSPTITYYPKTYTMESPAYIPGTYDYEALYRSDVRQLTSNSTISVESLSVYDSWSYDITLYDEPTSYYDAKDGFKATGADVWLNTQSNSMVAMITSLPATTFTIQYASEILSMAGITAAKNGSNYTVTTTGGDTATLIGLNASHMMFVFDQVNGTIQVSMIQNMEYFTGNFEAFIGQSETFETPIHSLTWLRFANVLDDENSATTMSYYVPYVYVLDQTTTGMKDVTISPQAISKNGLKETGGVVSMSNNVTYYGDSITITTANNTGTTISELEFDVVGSKMVNTQDENDWYYISGVTISLIPDPQGLWHLFINGTAEDTYFEPSTSQTAFTVDLGGSWKAGVLLAYVNEYNYNHYDWLAGTFNLNLQGYCTIGIITSVIASIGCVIFAREEGPAGLIPVAIAVAFAAIYLFIA